MMKNKGRFHWFNNCIRFYYQRTIGNLLHKRDKKLWVFSAWNGERYSDNSKYLFEYVSKNHKDITCVWLTKNKDLYNELTNRKVKVELLDSAKGRYIAKHAGVAFFTNSLEDFSEFPLIFGTKIVCLWHGSPVVKKNYMTLLDNYSALRLSAKKLKNSIYSVVYRDATMAGSQYSADRFYDETLTKNPIYLTGLARNDVFADTKYNYSDVLSPEIVGKYNLTDGSTSFVLYMPTYRGTKDGQKRLESYIAEMTKNEELNEYLERSNTKLIMKLHYLTDVSGLQFNRNIILLRDADVSDTQKLLQISDLLISDYSSVSIDYALKGNDILLFTPDVEEYLRENGLYKEYENILRTYGISAIEPLVKAIISSCSGGFRTSELSEKLNQLYNSCDVKPGGYCEKIYKTILDNL